MTSEYGVIAHPVPGKFRTWLIEALQLHRVWLWVNLAGMTTASAINIVGDLMDPSAACLPGPLGSTNFWIAFLTTLFMWLGNTVALLAGLVRLRDNSADKRLTMLALWLLTPVCWMLFCVVAGHIAGPDCCKFEGVC